MKSIILDKQLSIKKLDPLNQKDVWLVKELDKDKLICGENGYLWSIEKEMRKAENLQFNSIYQSSNAIYYKHIPIGYIGVSDIYESLRMVDISYALLDIYRGKGYATKTLREVSKIVLTDMINDVQKISLLIDPNNIKSQMVAERAGFISDGLSKAEHLEQGYVGYQKTKNMLKQEKH